MGEIGAVLDRRADDGQAERDVHALPDTEHLGGDVALIVIHGDRAVELALQRAKENGVAGQGPTHVEAASIRLLHGRRDERDLLRAEESAFARVRIQTGHRKVRSLDAEPAQAVMGELHDLQDPLGPRAGDRRSEGDVGAHVADAEFAGDQHHRDLGLAAEFGQQLRVTVVVETGGMQRGLVDG